MCRQILPCGRADLGALSSSRLVCVTKSALVSVLPDDSVGFVVLTNMNGTALPALLVRHASDLILGAEKRNWIAETMARRAQGEKAEKEAEKNKGTRKVKETKPAHELRW